jgi:anti-sigma regulatory factor (Ser/Thr protein kinase)
MTSWSRAFPGRPEQVSQAREFVASVLAGRPEADEAGLVTSELCTNAVVHSASGGPDGMFAVTVRRDADRCRISVQDMGSAHPPAMRLADDGEPLEFGRGLVLVAAVTKEWGATRNRLGWLVWAELASVTDDCAVSGR